MNLRRFELELDSFREDIEEDVLTMQRILATAALNGVVLKTPVDTGRLRGAWLTTVDFETSDAPEFEGSAGAAASTAVNAGLGVIASAQVYSNIIIQNNVDYAEDIEDGASKTQAPAGMLSVTVAEIERIFR